MGGRRRGFRGGEEGRGVGARVLLLWFCVFLVCLIRRFIGLNTFDNLRWWNHQTYTP